LKLAAGFLVDLFAVLAVGDVINALGFAGARRLSLDIKDARIFRPNDAKVKRFRRFPKPFCFI
jgi:hypothetical protein